MRAGLVALAVGLVAASLLADSGLAPGYRALAFMPFFVAAYGVTSALYGVCGFSALAGRRRTLDGAERVAERAELHRLRRVGIRVVGMSGALAVVATLFFVIAR